MEPLLVREVPVAEMVVLEVVEKTGVATRTVLLLVKELLVKVITHFSKLELTMVAALVVLALLVLVAMVVRGHLVL
jgi:hypothetical protein